MAHQLCRPPGARRAQADCSRSTIGWSETGYGDIVFWFQAAYGIGLLLRPPDRHGRHALGAGHRHRRVEPSAAWRMPGAQLGRALRDGPHSHWALGEAGAFPASVRPPPNGFPRRERALAIGIFNAGSNVGAHPDAAAGAGHRACLRLARGLHHHRPATVFVAARAVAVWSIAARASIRSCRREELAYIESDPRRGPAPGHLAPGCSPPARPGPTSPAAS